MLKFKKNVFFSITVQPCPRHNNLFCHQDTKHKREKNSQMPQIYWGNNHCSSKTIKDDLDDLRSFTEIKQDLFCNSDCHHKREKQEESTPWVSLLLPDYFEAL